MNERNDTMNLKVGKKEEYAARLAFFLPGFAVATWAPMIPMIKERLNIEADVLGILLLCIGISAFLFMPMGGMLGRMLGCRRAIIASAVVMALDIVVLSFLPSIWLYGVFLVIMGMALAVIEVNMNLNAVIVEKLAKKRMMSGMHAFWSVGGFTGAGLFGLLAYSGMPVLAIASVHCAIMLILTIIGAKYFLAYKGNSNEKAIAVPKGIVILFGLMACTSFLAEGAVLDWSGVFLAEVKHWDMSLAGLGYAVFSVAMLIVRLCGDKMVQLIGEGRIVVVGSLMVAAGFGLVIVFDGFYIMAIPFMLIGLGAANIVPVMFSRLKYQDDMPISSAVTAVTCMGYTGVILGPAVLGFIAHSVGLTNVFILLAVLMVLQAGVSVLALKK